MSNNINDLRHKLQRINLNFRSADHRQFQPRSRDLKDFIENNEVVADITSKVEINSPNFDRWMKSFEGGYAPNLDLSLEQRASLGLQATKKYGGKHISTLISLTSALTGDSKLDHHAKAYYETFVEPLCAWLDDQLSLLEETAEETRKKPSDLYSKEDILDNLNFIRGRKLKEIIARDLYEAQLCFGSSSKGVIVLCGGAIEALLIHELNKGQRKVKAVREFRREYPRITTNLNNVKSWKFEQIIKISGKVGLIDKGLVNIFNAIRNFRNFIHPYREIASKSSPDDNLASMAMSGAFHLLETLNKG